MYTGDFVCCLCSKNCEGLGNNPQPVKEEGRCCDECNQSVVLPARIQLMFSKKKPECSK